MPTTPVMRALARTIQRTVPLVPTPFAALADEFGLTEHQVLNALRRWKSEGLLLGITAVLEPAAVGYESALVVGCVPAREVSPLVAALAEHPLVGRIWGREHQYNFWFSMAAPVEVGIERMLRHLGLKSSAFFPLRRTVVFKTGLELDFERRRNISGEHTPPVTASVDLDSDAKAMLSVLQSPLDLVRTPFRYLARMAGLDEGGLLEFAQDQLGSTIRRYGASFDQVHVGVRDATILWNVNPRQLTKVGRELAAIPEVSTCEARQALPAFPYLLHTVVHTPDRASCEAIAQDVSKRFGIDDYCIVFTTAEYKKTRPRYFEADPLTLAHVNPVSAEDSSVATRS